MRAFYGDLTADSAFLAAAALHEPSSCKSRPVLLVVRLNARLLLTLKQVQYCHDDHTMNLMHAWPVTESKVKWCICLWGARAQQTCGDGLLVCPLGFCSLCIRIHLWQTAAVKHILFCHAGRSQMKSPANGRQYGHGRLERATPGASCMLFMERFGLSGSTLSPKHEARLLQAQKACLCW